jgi:asparagine synthase (glutamine-hydrolysing)
MCGIFGVVNTQGFFGEDEFQSLSKLNDLTRYRGPDDGGVCTLALKQGNGRSSDHFDVFLGNRRLSIIDLSPSGHQPMTDHQGHWIAYNGEIFNYLELRSELAAKGHKFGTGTDTEVILHLYSEYGEQGFERLNGMWAFAIADVPKRRILLSRDRFSIKPLYLLRRHGCIYFASEIKQLLPILPVRRLNEDVMSAFLTQGLLDHSLETFYQGIVKLAPRTNMSISMDTGEVNESTYWSFPPSANAGQPQDSAKQFRGLFLDSIRLRLRSDVKVGVLLSGGLDSSAIAVGSRAMSGDQVETYSVVSSDGLCDEHEFIDAVVNSGLKNEKIVVRCEDIMESLDRVLEHSDEPVGGFSVVAQFRLFESIKRQADATVLLSGQGGDEVLLGYLKFFFFYLKALYRQHRYAQACAELCASLWQRTVLHQFTLRSARRYIPTLSCLRQGVRATHVAIPVWECRDIASRQIADIEKYSVPALTHYEDRNSMAHSLEVRHPFLDHRLVEFLINLSPQLKIRSGWTKYVLRQAFPELPDVIRWRRDKQGFLTPEKQWLQHDLNDMIRAHFYGSRLSQAGILDDRKFLEYYGKFQNGAAISESDVSRVFIAEQWMRRTF